MTSIYNTGTVSVTNGNAVVTGSGTAWAVSLVTGGVFFCAGLSVPILSVDSDTQLTLALVYPGTTGSGKAYAIDRENSDAANIVDLYDKLTRVLITLSLAGIHPNNSGSLAKRDALTLTADDDNYLFLRAELGVAFAFYRWDGPTLAWIGPFPVADGAAGGPVSSLVNGTGITVDATNPAIPVVKLANMATSRLKGRATAGTGSPEDLTLSQALDMIGSATQGDILYRGSSTWQRLAKGTALQSLRMNLAATSPEWATADRRSNRLINGNGAFNQRGAATATDDTYGWDRHNVLTQTAAIGISTLSKVQNGLPYMMRMTQSQATAQRMGNSQIIESMNCLDLRGKTITLLGKLRNSLAAAVRYAILEWTGTDDVVVSDVVNSWTNGTFTAGQFFNSTTLNVLAVGALTPTAATATDFLLTAQVGNTATNLIAMIWTETAQAQNSTLDVAWELLDYDATGRTYPTEFRPASAEKKLCEWYCRLVGGQNTVERLAPAFSTGTTNARAMFIFEEMRAAPSIVTPSAANIQFEVSTTAYTGSALVLYGVTTMSFVADLTISGATAGLAGFIRANSTTSTTFILSSEL
ncbi:hypothetical protein [Mesorhizobium sp. B2-3-4]|uniref:hypothetical protein n=1 Tax=Mesorhizobium sp. B2-3-4 TaxID=2589959 RepID=UPI0011293D27|nr:hypothetical protein [Mesorhizobium sp. B2-3-4]TPM39573.1 hypothetical protein FJ967_08805 [Mesorhizobium sp. B2-3-4]